MARGDKKDYQAATFRLPPDLLDKLDIESTGTGLPKGTIVEKALRSWFDRGRTAANANKDMEESGHG